MLSEGRVYQLYIETLFDLHDMHQKGETSIEDLVAAFPEQAESFEKFKEEEGQVVFNMMINKLIMAIMTYGRVLDLPKSFVFAHLESAFEAEGLREALDQQIQSVYADSSESIH
jgi:hypothetical protein